MLSISNVVKIHPPAKRALDRVSLEIPDGVFGLLGPNGAGKSSLMEILAANLDWEGGTVVLDGNIDVRKNPREWRRRLGYLPQSFDFPAQTTGRELMEESALLLGLSPRKLKPRIDSLLERVNIHWAANRDASRYSRGMKQRLGFALSVLHDPRLLLLDEPTAGLDPEERVFFRDLLADIGQNRVVILSTHIVADIERCCSRIGVLDRGRAVFVGTMAELVNNARGRIWEAPAPAGGIDDLIGTRRVVSVVQGDSGARIRMVSQTSPMEGAERVSPGLEDAYMDLLEGRRLQEVDAS